MFNRKEFKTSLSENFRSALSPATGVVCGLAILIAVVAGPFGTFEAMGLGQRTVFWALIILVSVFVGYTVRALTTVLVGTEKPVLFDAVAVCLMTLVFGPTVWLISLVFDGQNGVQMPPTPLIYLYVFVVSLAVFVIRRLLPGVEERSYGFLDDEDGGAPALAETKPEPRLLRRLSPDMRGAVLRLSGQDHHVEIATDQGTETLRLRLGDAISEMDPVEGYCTHRSHWVARSAVKAVERENGQKLWLVLTNGDRVSVSRKYRPALEEAGLVNKT